jgi:hypothetical protein
LIIKRVGCFLIICELELTIRKPGPSSYDSRSVDGHSAAANRTYHLPKHHRHQRRGNQLCEFAGDVPARREVYAEPLSVSLSLCLWLLYRFLSCLLSFVSLVSPFVSLSVQQFLLSFYVSRVSLFVLSLQRRKRKRRMRRLPRKPPS